MVSRPAAASETATLDQAWKSFRRSGRRAATFTVVGAPTVVSQPPVGY